jgi:hypothetical protein
MVPLPFRLYKTKGPPSCTASHQAADRQSVFKDAKLAMRKQIEMEKAFDNQPFVDELTKAFNSLCTKFDIFIPAAYKTKLIFGAQDIVDALQNKAMPSASERECKVFSPCQVSQLSGFYGRFRRHHEGMLFRHKSG